MSEIKIFRQLAAVYESDHTEQGVAWSAQRISKDVNFCFLESSYFSIQVAPQLSSQG
jgi:hypothetical protein